MRLIKVVLTLIIGMSVLLCGCTRNEETEMKTATLYTNMDFLVTATSFDQSKELIIDWGQDSALIAGLDDRAQNEEFYVFDDDSLRWFMMDSLWRTVTENLDIENVYYTMDGGSDLVFDELYPIQEFPSDVPYRGSAFYYAHADNKGDEIISEGDAFTLVENTIKDRGDIAPVIVQNGEETIEGEHAFTFSAGDNSEDGEKFTAMYHYAVSDSGKVYYMDILQEAEWILVQ